MIERQFDEVSRYSKSLETKQLGISVKSKKNLGLSQKVLNRKNIEKLKQN